MKESIDNAHPRKRDFGIHSILYFEPTCVEFTNQSPKAPIEERLTFFLAATNKKADMWSLYKKNKTKSIELNDYITCAKSNPTGEYMVFATGFLPYKGMRDIQNEKLNPPNIGLIHLDSYNLTVGK